MHFQASNEPKIEIFAQCVIIGSASDCAPALSVRIAVSGPELTLRSSWCLRNTEASHISQFHRKHPARNTNKKPSYIFLEVHFVRHLCLWRICDMSWTFELTQKKEYCCWLTLVFVYHDGILFVYLFTFVLCSLCGFGTFVRRSGYYQRSIWFANQSSRKPRRYQK